mmetsp:Transcript_125487/g.297997  ORF Transcript_125487/g.297997 Transcript_125487/m.297997 type:complete len:267 (-) Transcript_125487:148-948(-)
MSSTMACAPSLWVSSCARRRRKWGMPVLRCAARSSRRSSTNTAKTPRSTAAGLAALYTTWAPEMAIFCARCWRGPCPPRAWCSWRPKTWRPRSSRPGGSRSASATFARRSISPPDLLSESGIFFSPARSPSRRRKVPKSPSRRRRKRRLRSWCLWSLSLSRVHPARLPRAACPQMMKARKAFGKMTLAASRCKIQEPVGNPCRLPPAAQLRLRMQLPGARARWPPCCRWASTRNAPLAPWRPQAAMWRRPSQHLSEGPSLVHSLTP